MNKEASLKVRSEEDLLMNYVLGEAPRDHRELAEELRRRGIDAPKVVEIFMILVRLIAKGGSTDGVD